MKNEFVMRRLDSIPQWQSVAWYLKPELLESDDFFYALYRRNWTHVEVEKLSAEDREFINELGRKYGPNGLFVPLSHWADMSVRERHRESHADEDKLWQVVSCPDLPPQQANY